MAIWFLSDRVAFQLSPHLQRLLPELADKSTSPTDVPHCSWFSGSFYYLHHRSERGACHSAFLFTDSRKPLGWHNDYVTRGLFQRRYLQLVLYIGRNSPRNRTSCTMTPEAGTWAPSQQDVLHVHCVYSHSHRTCAISKQTHFRKRSCGCAQVLSWLTHLQITFIVLTNEKRLVNRNIFFTNVKYFIGCANWHVAKAFKNPKCDVIHPTLSSVFLLYRYQNLHMKTFWHSADGTIYSHFYDMRIWRMRGKKTLQDGKITCSIKKIFKKHFWEYI